MFNIKDNEKDNVLATLYVKNIYNIIASHFDVTRTYYSSIVSLFLDDLSKYTNLLEIGCGNGKHLKYRQDIYHMGIDFSLGMCQVCHKKGLNITLANSLHLCFKDNYFDNSLCVAMLPHIVTEQSRIQVLRQICRVTKPLGKILIQVWSTYYINKKICKVNKYTKLNQNEDYLIKWTLPNTNTYYERFYHLFTKSEIIKLIKMNTQFNVIKITLEYHNWIIICQKSNDS
jgi:ubiquinone/menaquinone biosynthesis C-methylase UbiE